MEHAQLDEWDMVVNVEQRAYEAGVESGIADSLVAAREGFQSG